MKKYDFRSRHIATHLHKWNKWLYFHTKPLEGYLTVILIDHYSILIGGYVKIFTKSIYIRCSIFWIWCLGTNRLIGWTSNGTLSLFRAEFIKRSALASVRFYFHHLSTYNENQTSIKREMDGVLPYKINSLISELLNDITIYATLISVNLHFSNIYETI